MTCLRADYRGWRGVVKLFATGSLEGAEAAGIDYGTST